jgi:hypothetical protein
VRDFFAMMNNLSRKEAPKIEHVIRNIMAISWMKSMRIVDMYEEVEGTIFCKMTLIKNANYLGK